jgi:sugar lactone lactonase YvrE
MFQCRSTNLVNAAVFFVLAIFPEYVLADDFLGFLFVSQPSSAKVSYVKLYRNGNYQALQPIDLIGPEGLHHPQGVAIDHKRHRLFVADPDVQKVFAYQLEVDGDQLTCDGRQIIIAEGIEARWVAVDGLGNVFFSDEPNNRVYKLAMEKVLRGNTDAEILYDGVNMTQVNRPGGVAVDNFHVYWTNKHFGTTAGTVVKGAEFLTKGQTMEEMIAIIAQNSAKSYGVCLALNNVFFTDSDAGVYGVKKTGGEVHQISKEFKNPRGCVWDGDGTVFVADRGNNAVYSFAGNMHRFTTAAITKAFDMEDAFGLAMMSTATRIWSGLAFACCLISSFM